MPQSFVLIDGSYYMHSFFYSYKDRYNSKGEPTGALYGFTKMLLTLPKKFQTKNIIVIFDGPRSSQIRRAIYKNYKIDRPQMDESLSSQFRYIVRIIKSLGIKYYMVVGYEGDDVIGTLSRLCSEQPDAQVNILSRDKDMMQLVSNNVYVHNNNNKIDPDNFDLYYQMTPDQFGDFLALCGDKVDNIPGVPGIGPTTAKILLKQYGNITNMLNNIDHMSPAVGHKLQTYREQLLLSKQLATIDCQVPLDVQISDLAIKWNQQNYLDTTAIFNELGFFSLIDQIDVQGY